MSQQQQQPPIEDGPIPFFGAPPSSNRFGPPVPRQQQQRPVYPQQQQQQFPTAAGPVQSQPQRHPQQHPHQMQQQHQQGQQGFPQSQGLHRAQQPSRQMSQSPFAPAADLFASPPASNPIPNQSRSQVQAPPQGYQPQAGFPSAQGPPPQQQQQQQGQMPPVQRFPLQQSPVLQKTMQQQQQQPALSQAPPPTKPQQQLPPPQRPPVQPQQQQQPPAPNNFQRNPQQQQQHQQQQQSQLHFPQAQNQQQGFPTTQETALAVTAPVPPRDQTNSPFASASDLFGNSTAPGVSGWAIPSTVEESINPGQPFAAAIAHPLVNNAVPAAQQSASANLFTAGPPAVTGRLPLPPAPLQKQPSLPQVPQVQQAAMVPPPQRQPSLQPLQQLQQQPPAPLQQLQQPARQGSLSAQGPPRNSPIAPGPHGAPQVQPAAQLPPPPRSTGTPRQGPLSAPLSASLVQGASPYANHAPPKTPLLTAIQTPLMLPAQTPQAYQSSRTPYMGPVRNQVGSSSSQLLLEPCPFSDCGGENKPQAKFCSECGRAISAPSRSATPSLGHRPDFPVSNAPPMPSLDRMNSYSREYQQQPDEHQGDVYQSVFEQQQQQQTEAYQGYPQVEQPYQQPDQQQYGYTENQQGYDQGYSQGYEQQGYEQQGYEQQGFEQQSYDQQQGYDQQQAYDSTYDQGYGDAAYYDQDQQQPHYDPTTGQYLDMYAHQEQVVPEPEPEPEEEYINDPLNRLHGCPLIAFGFGGKILTAFPRTVQRFDSASNAMVTKRYPGDLQLKHIKDVLPVENDIATYPGPLLMDSAVQMKNKRKEVLKLIEDKIKEYELEQQDSTFDAHRVLIWRLFKVMFEQEGALVGGAKVDEAVRSVLLSIPLSVYPAVPSQEPISPIRSSASLDVLQELLRNGDRTGAVRYAMSTNLWAHALVISSCVNKELWKEAVNGFLNQELMTGGGDFQANGREAMRVLYALFSGQTQNAANELIPLNLRVPVDVPQNDAQVPEDQFVTAESLSMMKPIEEPKVPVGSLSQWRDTLIMILSNRTSGDQSAVSSLGDLLMKEGWVEAAHICYLLSPQHSVHSGPDAQLNRLVLIGADASPYAVYPFYKNVAAFQKTEIYEFACALRSAGATGGLPFLQAYKLHYVWTLVEWGMFSEAGRYLESIEAIVKSQTKGSPYYNAVFLDRLRDITERLTGSSQLAVAGESWFTKKVPKPTIGGIFDALDSKISKFIAGDNDQPKPVVVEPKANAAESGPFANAPALPDLSNIPPRAISRSSNGARAINNATSTDNRRSSRPSLEVPQTDVYSHPQPATSFPEVAEQSLGEDQSLGNYSGYDQTGQYGVETYPQGDYNVGYEYDQQQAYEYDSTQTYGETYQQGTDVSGYQGYDQPDQYQEQQPETATQEQQLQEFGVEEPYQAQAGVEGQYDAQYDAQYNAQYDAQYDGQYESYAAASTGETVAALAIQPDVAPASADSAHFSTTAVLGSEKPSVSNHQAVTEVEAEAAPAIVPSGEYDATYDQQIEGGEYNYTEDATYNGEYQAGEYQQGQDYQAQEYPLGQDYQQVQEYQQYDETYGEQQQQQQYDQTYGEEHHYEQNYGEHQQFDQTYGEQQYDQSAYQQFQPQNVEGHGSGAEHIDASYQGQGEEAQQPIDNVANAYTDAPVQEAVIAEKQDEVLADEPTFEQQEQTDTPLPTAAPVAAVTALETAAETVEGQQVTYEQTEYQQTEYQQGEYYQGDYQQAEHEQSQYQQDAYQEGDYQQGDYQQGEYQQDEHQQGDYQQDYQQGEYQQEEYQQGEYQQGEYHQEEYQQGEYQQGEYQQNEYDQGEYQQEYSAGGVPQQGDESQQQSSAEPGVLPVASEYQGQGSAAHGDQQLEDYAASGNNKAWWGNNGGEFQEEQQPLADAGATQEEPLQEDYEEGQFISFGAVPTIPSFGQPAAASVSNSHSNDHALDGEDDLGMGNNSLKKDKPAVADDANAAGSESQDANGANGGDGSDESKAGWWPKIVLFGGEKREPTPKPVKANLGGESSFYFDKEQNKWVNKNAGSETSSVAEPLPPPPMSRTATPGVSGSPVTGPPSGGTRSPAMAPAGVLGAGGPSPRPAAGSTARRGARSRYVDVLNTN